MKCHRLGKHSSCSNAIELAFTLEIQIIVLVDLQSPLDRTQPYLGSALDLYMTVAHQERNDVVLHQVIAVERTTRLIKGQVY